MHLGPSGPTGAISGSASGRFGPFAVSSRLPRRRLHPTISSLSATGPPRLRPPPAPVATDQRPRHRSTGALLQMLAQ
ncbi:unnamed protein product [Urochloa humidicola]